MRSRQRERVVVVGGGYAGTVAALRLAGRARRRVSVTLVDPKDSFVQRLRLHQIATGQKVAHPAYGKLLRRKVAFLKGSAELIDCEHGRVELRDGRSLPFDRLIYTIGSTVDLSSVPGVREYAQSVQDITAARGLSHAVHYASDGSVVAVVGGGMTGLEVASEIATAYPVLKVKLLTSGETGGWLSGRGRQYITAALAQQGVEVIEQVRVRQIEPERLLLADGAEIAARLIVWCGGFRASDLARRSGLDTDERGRVLVDRMLHSVSHPQIVAAGDSAATPPFVAGMPLRMCCQAAGPAAAHAADVVRTEIRARDPKEFHFGYVHQPISLGRRDGLIQFVDRADRPKNSILTGRRAAIYKELVTAGTIPSIKMERLMPGATKWPFKEPKTQPQLESGATLHEHA